MTPASPPSALLANSQQPQLVLRDIHLPQPVSWWPLAPGWWLLLVLAAIILIATLFALSRYRRRRYRRIALQQLSQLEENFIADHNRQLLLQEISKLLRHIAVLHYPPQQCAGLCAEKWLSFLDSTLSSKDQQRPFSSGVGRCLASAPYEATPQAQAIAPEGEVKTQAKTDDSDTAESLALIQLSRHWLKKLPLPPRPRRSA